MHKPHRHGRQRGVSLIFALLTLMVLGLATLALVRTVDTSSLLLGNVSFKQDSTAAADQAVRAAFVWLKSQADLGADVTGQGYYASTREYTAAGVLEPTKPVDVTGQMYPSVATRQLIDWYPDDSALKNCAYAKTGTCTLVSHDAGTTQNGNNSMRYAIFRLCSMTDAQATATGANNNCATPAGLTGGSHEAGERTPQLAASGAFYRIVVLVKGSRNSVSFIETIVQL